MDAGKWNRTMGEHGLDQLLHCLLRMEADDFIRLVWIGGEFFNREFIGFRFAQQDVNGLG